MRLSPIAACTWTWVRKMASPRLAPREIGAPEVGSEQIGLSKVGAAEFRPDEAGAAQVRPAEICAVVAPPGQVRASKRDPGLRIPPEGLAHPMKGLADARLVPLDVEGRQFPGWGRGQDVRLALQVADFLT